MFLFSNFLFAKHGLFVYFVALQQNNITKQKNKPMNYQVGIAKTDITAVVYNKGMMGYAVPHHIVKDVKTPLSARAFVILDKTNHKKVVIVNSEICFYTIALKDAVVKKLQAEHADLGFSEENVMLSAQHTHSAPGGYSHYILYNIAIPGFQPKVFNKVVNSTVEVIVAAHANLKDASMQFAEGRFDEKDEVAFCRSLGAYNANPEVKEKISKKNHHLAIDRNMKLLRFNDADGNAIGAINWFGVHTTSVNNDKNSICYDNKGYAAAFMEKNIGTAIENPDFIAAFAQDTAGDVSPNPQWNNKHGRYKGKFKDDYKSAAYNGKLQARQAEKLLEAAKEKPAISAGLDYIAMFVDFSNIDVDSNFTMGMKGKRTAPPATGVALLKGAQDRPAVEPAILNSILGVASSGLSKFIQAYEIGVKKHFLSRKDREDIEQKYRIHGTKAIMLEVGKGKILGTYFINEFIMPAALDPTIARLKQMDREGYSKRTPWMPRILPIQIITLGELAFLGIPAEITTIAGQRLRKAVLEILKHKGVRKIILTTYANGYSGYITTHEEYAKQSYEGGHTIFGKWTLAAYQTKFCELAREIKKPENERNIDKTMRPDIFKEDEIWYG